MEAPENTAPAFRRAIELHADFIECDVRVLKEGIPVVTHRARVLDQPVEQLTLPEMKQWDAGGWFLKTFAGEKVMTLREMLTLDFGKTGLMIEIKHPESSRDVALQHADCVYEVIKTHKPEGMRYHIGSLSIEIVAYLREKDPTLPLVGIACSEEDAEILLSFSLPLIALRHQLVTQRRTDRIRERGGEVWCWTIDDPHFPFPALPDGIITNNLHGFYQLSNY